MLISAHTHFFWMEIVENWMIFVCSLRVLLCIDDCFYVEWCHRLWYWLMYNSLYLFVCVHVVFLFSSFVFFVIQSHNLICMQRLEECVHTHRNLSKHALTTKTQFMFRLLFSIADRNTHALTSKFNGVRNTNGNKKVNTVPPRIGLFAFVEFVFENFSPQPLATRSLSLSISLFCHLKHSRHSHTLLAFTFILIPIEAYFLRLKCIYWFYRDSVWWMLIAHRWCLLTANESLFLSHLNILFLYTQCPTKSQHTIPMGEVKQQLGYQRACVSSKMQTVSVGFYWILNTRFPKLSLSIYLGVCWLCRTSIDHISIDWLKFSRMPNKWRMTAGNNNIINRNATITANSWNRQRNSSERMWKRRRWKKKNAATRLRLNASRNGTRFNKILS